MKTATIYRPIRPAAPAYPNAADRRYYLRKFLDGALAVATAVGAITALVFFILL